MPLYNPPSGGAASVNFSAGTTSNNLTNITFADSNGVSFGLNGSTMTASVAGGAAITNIRVSAGTTSNLLSAITFSNSNGLAFGIDASTVTGSYTVPTVTNSSWTVSDSANSATVGRLAFTAANGLTLTLSTSNDGNHTVFGSYTVPTQTVQSAIKAFGASNTGNTAGNTGVSTGVDWVLAGSTNITVSESTVGGGPNTLWLSCPNVGGSTYTNYYEPFALADGSATMTGSLSQLNVQPFSVPMNLSFGQINLVGIATMPTTSASNSHSARLTNSTQRYTFGTTYTIGNTNLVDWYLFSRGAGVSTSELQTFASTRNSFITNYRAYYNGGATLTNASGGSVSGTMSLSMTISYPFLTSYTSTSVNPASSYTGYRSGYTTWTSSASNSSTFTMSTSAARTLSIGTTFPATVGWSGAKLVNMNFGTSLTPGEYWLGNVRYSSSSSSSDSANAFTGAAGTGNSYSATFNHTAYGNTQQLTFAGKTLTIANSMGSLGFVTTANMAVAPGLGSFSGTWTSSDTYLNNMGNPAGAIALTQIRSNVSMFQSWFRLASNLPV